MVDDSLDKRSQIPDSAENQKKCFCTRCPSYPHDCSGELLYCARGISACDIPSRGCICNTCPLFFEYELEGLYFCSRRDLDNNILIRKKSSDEDVLSYEHMVNIRKISVTGQSTLGSMGSPKKLDLSWDDLHFLPAQIRNIPLNKEEHVKTEIIIGSKSEKPLILSSPIIISGMSFGAVSRTVRNIIAKTAHDMGVGFNSGEGGILPEELELASSYFIVQYSTGRFGLDEKILSQAAAVEIRFGQGAYPGKGSYLPAEKITAEVARVRGLEIGDAAYSPAHHPDIKNQKQLEEKVNYLRSISQGSPVGAKIGCGNVEDDIRVLVDSGVDYIALDGFGGGTGATDLYVRENVGLPIWAALPRAVETLEQVGVKGKVSLIAGGGLRSSADCAKCLALGADAVYLGTAILIAINCEQHRICYTGLCPTGIATQNPQLSSQLKEEEGIRRLKNFIQVYNHEIQNITRIVGKNNIKHLNKNDLVALKRDMARITGVKWLNGNLVP